MLQVRYLNRYGGSIADAHKVRVLRPGLSPIKNLHPFFRAKRSLQYSYHILYCDFKQKSREKQENMRQNHHSTQKAHPTAPRSNAQHVQIAELYTLRSGNHISYNTYCSTCFWKNQVKLEDFGNKIDGVEASYGRSKKNLSFRVECATLG